MRQEHSPWFKYICSMCQYSLSPAWGCFSTAARPPHSNVETTLDRGKGESSNRLWAAHTEQFLRQPAGTWLLARSYTNTGKIGKIIWDWLGLKQPDIVSVQLCFVRSSCQSYHNEESGSVGVFYCYAVCGQMLRLGWFAEWLFWDCSGAVASGNTKKPKV